MWFHFNRKKIASGSKYIPMGEETSILDVMQENTKETVIKL